MYNYKPHSAQVKSNVESHIFYKGDITLTLNDLNYFEKNQRIKSIAARKLKGKGQCVIQVFDYLLMRANNKTGVCYPAQETISEFTYFSNRQVIRAIQVLIEVGLIYKVRRGLNVSNAYMINFELINDLGAVREKPPSILKSYPRKPRKTCSLPEVTSNVTLTTNTEERVSINTNCNTNFSIKKEEVVFETDDPIPLTEDLVFRKVTLDSISKKTGLTGSAFYEFLERMEKAYRYKYRDHTIRRTIDHWNADFNIFCYLQKRSEDRIPTSRRIDPIKRLLFKEKNPIVANVTKSTEPPETLTMPLIMQDNNANNLPEKSHDYRNWTPEEEAESDDALQQLIQKINNQLREG